MSDILMAKPYIPRVRPNLVLRPNLKMRLLAGTKRMLTLITAPASTDKTTLLKENMETTRNPP